jgi:predicted nucleotidyltransferase
MTDIGSLISSKVRIELLRILALNPESSFYINELSRRTGFSPRGVEKELKNLLAGGILKREVTGNQHRYQLDPSCPINTEIRGIVLKTVGLSSVLEKALSPAQDKIELAFVFGSFASGDYANDSDIDLFVVSDLPGVKLAEILGPVQNEIGRAINTSQFAPTEYKERKQRGNHFLTRVLDGPRIMIIGEIDES